MSSSPLDEQGIDLFDETATAVGSFPRSLRGYHVASVDSYVRELEAKLSRALSELREAQYKLMSATLVAEDTDFARLGGYTRNLLRAAEAQAAEIVANARSEAERVRGGAEVDSARAGNEGQLALDAAQAAYLADLNQVRQQLAAQTEAELQAARAEAAGLHETVARERVWMVSGAETQARAIIDAAHAEAEVVRAESERLAVEQAAELAQSRQDALAALAQSQLAAVASINDQIAAAHQQADEYRARMHADAQTWEQRLDAARAEAAEVTRAARAEAANLVQTARHEVEQLKLNATAEAAEQVQALARELEALSLRKQEIATQLEALSAERESAPSTEHIEEPAEAPSHP